jgi:sorbitol-specific phosphotransferase system component IIC
MKGACMKRKQSINLSVVSVLVATVVSIVAAPVSLAFDRSMSEGADAARGVDQAATLFGATGIFTTISNVMLFVIGAISVIMVIVGGLRYVISGGNSANITAAKNTILYAVVGLIIAIMAYAIINFVLESFLPGSGGAAGGTNV